MLHKVGGAIVSLGEKALEYYQSNDYHPNNREHAKHVQTELAKFIACRDALYAVDGKIVGGFIVADIVLPWISSSLSFLTNIALLVYVAQFAERKQCSDAFQAQLKKTIELYQWCTAKQPINLIEEDPNFLALTKALAPHMNWKDSNVQHFDAVTKPYIGFFQGMIAKGYTLAYGYQATSAEEKRLAPA